MPKLITPPSKAITMLILNVLEIFALMLSRDC